jgi:hypothetical protein
VAAWEGGVVPANSGRSAFGDPVFTLACHARDCLAVDHGEVEEQAAQERT